MPAILHPRSGVETQREQKRETAGPRHTLRCRDAVAPRLSKKSFLHRPHFSCELHVMRDLAEPQSDRESETARHPKSRCTRASLRTLAHSRARRALACTLGTRKSLPGARVPWACDRRSELQAVGQPFGPSMLSARFAFSDPTSPSFEVEAGPEVAAGMLSLGLFAGFDFVDFAVCS